MDTTQTICLSAIDINSKLPNSSVYVPQAINGKNAYGETRNDLKAYIRATILELRTRRSLGPYLGPAYRHLMHKKIKVWRWQLMNESFNN